MSEHNSDVNQLYDPEVNYDEAIIHQQKEIENEIVNHQMLIGHFEDFSSLEQEYALDPVYLSKVQELKSKYRGFRRTRGDGNCFYRAFGFAYFESLLSNKEDYKRFEDLMKKSLHDLLTLGFPKMTLEDFHENFMNVLQEVGGGVALNDLFMKFNDQGLSDYLIVFLRILVSGHLQDNSAFFENFMENGITVKEFCSHEVEPMGRESDHIHVIALTTATEVPVAIEYMDRNESQTALVFPDNAVPKITLLYRPGHYDILYS